MIFHTALTTVMREVALHPVFPEDLVGIAESPLPFPLLSREPTHQMQNWHEGKKLSKYYHHAKSDIDNIYNVQENCNAKVLPLLYTSLCTKYSYREITPFAIVSRDRTLHTWFRPPCKTNANQNRYVCRPKPCVYISESQWVKNMSPYPQKTTTWQVVTSVDF